jgi:hypothetical protein
MFAAVGRDRSVRKHRSRLSQHDCFSSRSDELGAPLGLSLLPSPLKEDDISFPDHIPVPFLCSLQRSRIVSGAINCYVIKICVFLSLLAGDESRSYDLSGGVCIGGLIRARASGGGLRASTSPAGFTHDVIPGWHKRNGRARVRWAHTSAGPRGGLQRTHRNGRLVDCSRVRQREGQQKLERSDLSHSFR